LAEIIGTLGGFGSSLLFVPIAAYFFDFETVLGITALFHIASNLSKIALFRKGLNRKLVLYIGIPSVVFVILGAYLSQFVQGMGLEWLLSCFLVLFSFALLLWPNWSLKPSPWVAATSGGVAGGLAGVLGTGGAIRGMALAAFTLPIEVFIATSAAIDLAVDTSRAVVYFYNGYMQTDYLWLVIPLVMVAAVGSWIGKILLTRLDQVQFKRLVLLLVLAVGISGLVKGLL
jgi:uncharacterized membrane protein YfcA